MPNRDGENVLADDLLCSVCSGLPHFKSAAALMRGQSTLPLGPKALCAASFVAPGMCRCTSFFESAAAIVRTWSRCTRFFGSNGRKII